MQTVLSVARFFSGFSAVTVDRRLHRGADLHRRGEAQRLAHVERARPGQAGAEHGGDQAGGEHAVGDALAEDRGFRGLGVDVHRVGVHADRGVHQDVGLGDGLGEAGRLADGEVREWHIGWSALCAGLLGNGIRPVKHGFDRPEAG